MKILPIILILLILSSASVLFAQNRLMSDHGYAIAQVGPPPPGTAPRPPPPGRPGGPQPPVTLRLQDTPVREAINMLFEGRGIAYAIAPDAEGTVSINLVDIPFDAALATLLRAAGLTARVEAGSYIIGRRKDLPGSALAGPGAIDILPSGRPGQPATFDLSLDNAGAYDVIVRLMEMAGRDYAFDLGLPAQGLTVYGPRVTASLKDMTFEQALEAITRVSGLSVEKAGAAYLIKLTHPQPMGAQGIGGPQNPGTMSPGNPAIQFRCPKCSGPLSPDWRFCPNCGTQVQSAAPRPGQLPIIRRPSAPAGPPPKN